MSTLPYDAMLETVDGSSTTLESFKDHAVLVVNVASRCGLTPQYALLEELQKAYGERGFTVLGFPCNQFNGQEPGTNEEIAEFCSVTYGATFPIFGKIEVNGDHRHEIFAALAQSADSDGESGDIQWNFEKFLIAPGGEVIGRFRPRTSPDDPLVISAIESALRN